ncbi:MAG TPA: hypothetical protein VI197_13880 [Polyangiaceae bacterium]
MDSETQNGAQHVSIPADGVVLSGEYMQVRGGSGLVVLVCAHRGNARRRAEQLLIAQLHRSRIMTLRVDLMTKDEAAMEVATEQVRQDVERLAQRVRAVDRWAEKRRLREGLAVGYYGSGSAACAALRLAARQKPSIEALVICEVKGDISAPHSGTQADAELICDLFRNWLWWEKNPRVRVHRPPRVDDRPSAAP